MKHLELKSEVRGMKELQQCLLAGGEAGGSGCGFPGEKVAGVVDEEGLL